MSKNLSPNTLNMRALISNLLSSRAIELPQIYYRGLWAHAFKIDLSFLAPFSHDL